MKSETHYAVYHAGLPCSPVRFSLAAQAGRRYAADITPQRLSPRGIFRHFSRAPGGLGELRRNLRGLRRRAPARRLAAIAPGARAVERVHAEFVHLLHFAHPGRVDPVSMIMGRL